MWIKRDFEGFLRRLDPRSSHPVKVLKGPRQVGKTSLLERVTSYQKIEFDDLTMRQRAQDNPRLFLDQFKGPLILDEATRVPELFPEIKRRVDEFKRKRLNNEPVADLDIWLTGSNQTLKMNSVQESLAGRASYFDLNTLSLHEMGELSLSEVLLRGGWPELHAQPSLEPVSYLNDLIATFIERDIVAAAGIERHSAFTKMIGLISARVGQLFNGSDIARSVGAELTTIQSWINKLEQNAIIYTLRPYFTNLNQRLIKTPKIYFHDVGFATRFQGWTEFEPLYKSPAFGGLVENLALAEVIRFFQNRASPVELFFLRSKEKIEIDLLIKLPNNKWIAAEIKTTAQDFSEPQIALLKKTGLDVLENWVLTPANDAYSFKRSRVVAYRNIFDELSTFF